MEDMATSGSPIRLQALPDWWAAATKRSLDYFLELVETQGEPF